jgi:signal transduction histidine kinase
MDNSSAKSEQNRFAAQDHVPIGLAGIDENGRILYLNSTARTLLPLFPTGEDAELNNLFPIFQQIKPGISGTALLEDAGKEPVVFDALYSLAVPGSDPAGRKQLSISVSRIISNCYLVCFQDLTNIIDSDTSIKQLVVEKAVAQGRSEFASDVLHDIGNAVVGFGLHLSRIRHSLEGSKLSSLQKLAEFFTIQRPNMAVSLGEPKVAAIITMLAGIIEWQKGAEEEMNKSIGEQLHIISHIQEILTIQRQYVAGKDNATKEPVNWRSIINDCLAMLYPAIDKRGIVVSMNVPAELPAMQGDRTRLMQVVLNILKNSVEAVDMTKADKTIAIGVAAKEEGLVLQITDNGIGFDRITADKLFGRGFTTKRSGTGLGLNNCRLMVEGHGGTMEIGSEGVGMGAQTTIRFRL